MVRWALDKFWMVLKGRILPSTWLRSPDRNIRMLPNLIDIEFLAHNYANFWRRWNFTCYTFLDGFCPFHLHRTTWRAYAFIALALCCISDIED